VHSAAADLDRKVDLLRSELQKAKAEGRSSGSIRKLEADISTWTQRRAKLGGSKKPTQVRELVSWLDHFGGDLGDRSAISMWSSNDRSTTNLHA
jgi:hypothetical protein